MELELPRRLYGEGLEPQVKKINNNCQMKLLELLREKMKPEYDEVMKDPMFSHIMVIEENGLKFSTRLVNSFMCKELMTSKKHEKWFTFARRPLRFSLQEYHVVTCLKAKQEKNSGLVKWKDDMEARLIYLCVIMGVVMGRDEKVIFSHLYMKLAMDLDKLQKYPWSMYSFDFLVKSIDKTKDKFEQKEGYLMERFLFGLWKLFMLLERCVGILHSVMEFHRNGLVLLATDYDEGDKEEGEDESKTEIGESSHVAENTDDTTTDSGRNKRNNADRGVE
ncbi:hypothetical protein N665_0420s0011 [Sinapis alba]|nr:hypothetical protein N665_0420s0011 [Sinapis alba]